MGTTCDVRQKRQSFMCYTVSGCQWDVKAGLDFLVADRVRRYLRLLCEVGEK